MSSRSLFTSESVTAGHPDKICDQISDAVLDAILAKDPNARVACETAVTTGLVLVSGEISTTCYVDIPKIVRETIREIGYTRAKYGFDADTCAVLTSIDEQSPDIAMGVDAALEKREGRMTEEEIEAIGAGDQGLMFGFACNETPELMPLPISLAHRLARRLHQVRIDGILPYLRPDGKTQVTVEYEGDRPVRIDTVVVSAQHAEDVTLARIKEDILEHVIRPVVPEELLDAGTKYFINPTGRFVIGGPQGDAGSDGPEDHRRHLRGIRPPRRRGLLREGPDQGGPFGGLCRPLCGQKHRGRRVGRQMRSPGGVRHRRGAAGLHPRRHLRHGKSGREPLDGAGPGPFRPASRRESFAPWICAGPSTGKLRPTDTSAGRISIFPGNGRTKRKCCAKRQDFDGFRYPHRRPASGGPRWENCRLAHACAGGCLFFSERVFAVWMRG